MFRHIFQLPEKNSLYIFQSFQNISLIATFLPNGADVPPPPPHIPRPHGVCRRYGWSQKVKI
jgi:hypothetical protein